MLVILVFLLSANCFINPASSFAEASSGSPASVVANHGNSEKVVLPSKGYPSKPPTGDKNGLHCSGPNEFYACGGACDNVCAELSSQSQKNCPIINIKCNDQCYCKEGYARDAKGICIPIDKCPGRCPENEEYTSNKPICPSDKCSSILARCAPKLSGMPGCVCKPGFLRKEEGAPCTPTCECSESSLDCHYKSL